MAEQSQVVVIWVSVVAKFCTHWSTGKHLYLDQRKVLLFSSEHHQEEGFVNPVGLRC